MNYKLLVLTAGALFCAGQSAEARVALPFITPFAVYAAAGLGSGVPLFVYSKNEIKKLNTQLKELQSMPAENRSDANAAEVKKIRRQLSKWKGLRGLAIGLMTAGSIVAVPGVALGAAEVVDKTISDKMYGEQRKIQSYPKQIFNPIGFLEIDFGA